MGIKSLRKRVVTLNELLREKAATMSAEGRHGSATNYRSLCHYITDRYGEVDVKLFNADFTKRMKADMEREGKSPATVRSYFSFLAVVWNYACYRRYVKSEDYPFRRHAYEIDRTPVPKAVKRDDKYLSKKEMNLLWDAWEKADPKTCNGKSIKKWVGLFLASYLCNGANFADILRMKYDRAWRDSGGRVVSFVRRKTRNSSGAVVRVPLTDKLIMILDEIGCEPVYGGPLFPWMSDLDENSQKADYRVIHYSAYAGDVLKRLAKKIGVRKDICVTFARHSYCHVLTSQNVSYSIVERNMGHSLGISDHYMGEIPVETLFSVNAMLF